MPEGETIFRSAHTLDRALAGRELVRFEAPVVELTEVPAVEHLGPDLCRPDADLGNAVRRLDDDQRRRLLATASEQLRANLGNVDRPCRRCGATLGWAPQGEQRRGTDWCRACQPAPGA